MSHTLANDDSRLLIPIREASLALAISARTLWGLTAPRGLIPCVRLGGRVLYDPRALRRFIDQQQAGPPATDPKVYSPQGGASRG